MELLGRLDERTERTEQDVGLLKHVLIEGNGVPPVTVQLAILTNEVASLKEKDRESRIPRHIWLVLIVSSLISIIGIIVAVKTATGG